MDLSRRSFFSALLFARPTQKKSVEAAVLESFDIDGRTVAVLANHADASVRQEFAHWLRGNPKQPCESNSIGGSNDSIHLSSQHVLWACARRVAPTNIDSETRSTLSRVEPEWRLIRADSSEAAGSHR
jgi:hypothetical protein